MKVSAQLIGLFERPIETRLFIFNIFDENHSVLLSMMDVRKVSFTRHSFEFELELFRILHCQIQLQLFFSFCFFFSPLDDQSEDKVLEKLRKMDLDEDDDIDNLLTVSKNCRPILEHKLVNRLDFISFRFEKFV